MVEIKQISIDGVVCFESHERRLVDNCIGWLFAMGVAIKNSGCSHPPIVYMFSKYLSLRVLKTFKYLHVDMVVW